MAKIKKLPPVFLSAGIPDPRREKKYIETADIIAIREAVTALTQVVAPRGRLVFGGQPAISPLVFLAAKSVNSIKKVSIYQSDFFRDQIPKESLAFNNFKWASAGADRQTSLIKMRKKMLRSQKFGFGIFIGGMEGVEEEYEMFCKSNPNAKVFPIPTTGAAAKIIFDRSLKTLDQEDKALLKTEYVYGWLFQKLLGLQDRE